MTALLTLDETAKLLHVSPSTVRSLSEREGLPVIRVSARRYLVSEEGLREWLAGRVVNGAAGAATRSGAVGTGASPSRLPRLSDDDARSGSSGQRRPPCASSKPSSGGSVVAYRQRKAQ